MNQLHIDPIWLPITGTNATAALHKGLQGIGGGTRSGTQAEQCNSFIGVPTSQVEQEHKRNSANRCWARVCGGLFRCSAFDPRSWLELPLCRFSGVVQ
jgi:hypothetical protein